MHEIGRNSVIKNFFWRFAERCGAQGVSFIVSIVLARILAPDVYGTIALVTVFTNILNVFVDSGLGNALIQKKDADDIDFSSVFYFNIGICCILYCGMFFAAPYIADFYNNPSLTLVIRMLSLTLVISGVKNIQQAYVSRTMQFKKFFLATIGGTIGAAIVGVCIAYLGGGIWALVVQQIFNTSIDTIILWITVKWRPQRCFSSSRLKGLLSYGWKLLVSSLIDTVYNNIWQLIIGRMYSSLELAYYNQGDKFPNIIVSNINTSINSVLMPTMSSAQDNKDRVKSMTRRAIKTSTYIMTPLMIGLAVCGDAFVSLILTEKWLPCVSFLRILCISYMFYPIHTANLNAIKAMGRSDLFLRLEVIKKIVLVTVLLCFMWYGVLAMAYSMLLSSILGQIINSWPNRRLLNYRYLEQIRDILPGILLSFIMGIIVYFLGYIPFSKITVLVIQVIGGASFYIGFSAIFHLEAFEYLWDVVQPLISRLNR